MIAPIMDELAGEHAGSVRFAKLNVDENPQTAARFNVLSIPMVTLFADGEAQETVVGARPKSYYEGAWDRWLAGQR
jgi:thioredoxin 1